MELSTAMGADELARTKMQVDTFNKTLANGRVKSDTLDKNDFLKILVTQLQHQDPTSPMQDKDFIAQMAQFSSLEQITNLNQGFSKLSALLAANEAATVLGKSVEISSGDSKISGVVEKVLRGENPMVQVGGKLYDYAQIDAVLQ